MDGFGHAGQDASWKQEQDAKRSIPIDLKGLWTCEASRRAFPPPPWLVVDKGPEGQKRQNKALGRLFLLYPGVSHFPGDHQMPRGKHTISHTKPSSGDSRRAAQEVEFVERCCVDMLELFVY